MQTRRSFLTRSALIGCSLAASPLLTPVSFAGAPWDNRLVVIILRGGMDGLDAVQPVGDRAFAPLRGQARHADPINLDGYWALHPGLRALMPLWQAGQMQVAHAVSTPYRDKRSHFDGQDLLEAGTINLGPASTRDGWLNRLLQQVPGIEAETAYSIGVNSGPILAGSAPVTRWSPDADLALSPQAMRLTELVMQDDPRFASSLSQAFLLAASDGDSVEIDGNRREIMSAMAEDMRSARRAGSDLRLAAFAAERLRGEARIASFSINGWDTHDNQQQGMTNALSALGDTILALKDGLGPVWDKTVVLTMTEFGRTVRVNGTRGTDHGTGGAMLLTGGALDGSRVVADWPGLEEASLYDRRDLMPTRDVRAHAGWVMRSLFGLDSRILQEAVFPGVDLGRNPGHLA